MSQSFVVRDLFPTDTFHLIYGPSGAGRSTLLFQIMWEWHHGREVLGHESFPAPFILISTLQSKAALGATLRFLGMDPSKIPILSLLDQRNREDRTIQHAYRLAENFVARPKVLFIDGMTGLCPENVAIYRQAYMFLMDIAHECSQHNFTVIGTASCGKSDDESKRQYPIGSVAWTEMASTKISIEPTDRQDPTNPDRTILIRPRLFPPSSAKYTLDPETHLFVPAEEMTSEKASLLNGWLEQFSPDQELAAADIVTGGAQLGISKATVYRWIKEWVDLGLLKKASKGRYCKTPRQ